MSNRRRRAFAPDGLRDLDEFLPDPPRVAPSPASTDSPSKPDAVVAPTPFVPRTVPNNVEDRTSRTTTSRKRVREGSAPERRPKIPEVSVDARVADALRALTLQERRRDTATARSYGRVALDAVDAHAEALQTHWLTEPVSNGSGSLFTRNNTPQRRRHSTPPARIPLAGISSEDTEQLDTLAERWGAGSRSALVDEALRRYLNITD